MLKGMEKEYGRKEEDKGEKGINERGKGFFNLRYERNRYPLKSVGFFYSISTHSFHFQGK
jgi:hypothetical protein